MLKFALSFCLFAGLTSLSQQASDSRCTLLGAVVDKNNSGKIPFASIILYKNDTTKVEQTSSDMEGNFCFKTLKNDIYKIVTHCAGYNKKTLSNIKVTNQPTRIIITLIGEAKDEDIKSDAMILQEESQNRPDKNISVVPMISSGVYKKSKEKSYLSQAKINEYNTEEYSRIYDNEFKESKKDPLSTFSIDVDKASYSNIRRFINKGQLPNADAVRIEEMINYFTYNYPKPLHNEPFSISTEYTDCPWNKNHNLIHIGLQGRKIELDNLPANNLVFLLDVSGSMESEDKLPLLKLGLRLLVEQMRSKDKIAIVVYAGAAGVVLPPTSGDSKERIYDALEKLQAGGSTAGGEGILLAYKTAKENFLEKGNNRIILATDGDFNVGASSDGELTRLIEKQREGGVFLSVFGFGTGNYKDSKMEQLADKGNGNYAYIDNLLEAKKVLVKEMGGTLLTIAKDVKLQIEFNPAKVKGYRLVGYENRLLNNEDFNDDKKDAGELGSGHTVTAIYEIIPAGSPELVASIDPLKYQQVAKQPVAESNEVMTIKFRYKEPKESSSQLITHIVEDKKTAFATSSENCRFSCAVAEFGMILRDSKFRGDSDFKTIIALAKEVKERDEDGYRAEFIRLVEMAELLMK